MKNKVPITIGAVVVLIAGVFVSFNIGDTITPVQLQELDFDPADIQFLSENVQFATSTDEFEEVIRTGIRVPIKYNFLVASSTGFVVEEIDGEMSMTLDGYNLCRSLGGTKNVCLSELRDDIESNLLTFQENLERKLKELKRQQFRDEVNLDNL